MQAMRRCLPAAPEHPGIVKGCLSDLRCGTGIPDKEMRRIFEDIKYALMLERSYPEGK
jgi:hypothetical protein